MNVGIRTGDRCETFKDRAQTRYGILWRNNAPGQDALNHWIFKSAKKKYAEAMCMAENERQRRGERCWSDQKSFCVKYNLRKGSKNVGENQRFTKCFQFKALARRLCKRMRAWSKVDVISLYWEVPYCAKIYRKYRNAWKLKRKMKRR